MCGKSTAIGLHARLGAVGRRLEMRNMHLDAPTEPASIHAALAFASRLALLVLLLRNSGSPPRPSSPASSSLSICRPRTHARTHGYVHINEPSRCPARPHRRRRSTCCASQRLRHSARSKDAKWADEMSYESWVMPVNGWLGRLHCSET